MKKRLVAIAALMPTLSACTYAIAPYQATNQDDETLRKFEGTTVNVERFESDGGEGSELFCRGSGNVTTPDGQSFAEYIEEALVEELDGAGIYASDAPVTISGLLEELDFTTTSGSWKIGLRLDSSNGRTMSTHEVYEFESAFVAAQACSRVATAFTKAVQSHLDDVIRDPEFHALLEP